MDRDSRIITPREVEGMIADGRTVVILDEMVLRLDGWLDKHPGGKLAIMHMIGRDATDEIKVYHSAATLNTMKAFRIGRKPAGPWVNMTPPIRGGVYTKSAAASASASVPASGSTTPDATDAAVECPLSDLDEDESADDAVSEVSARSSRTSLTSECSSAEAEVEGTKLAAPTETGIRRRIAASTNLTEDDALLSGRSRMTAEQYTDWAIQQNVNKDIDEYPSLDPAVQLDIQMKYRLLHERVKEAGLYDCPYLDYGKEICRYSILFASFLFALRHEWYMTSACFLGLFWHQIMFSAHDAGHGAITHNFTLDTLIGLFIADFCCGLSMGWWKSSHNVHHLITNMPEHDPDIQNVPLFATCPSFFKSIKSTYYDGFVFVWDAAADVLAKYQAYTYYPVMGIARFNLYLLSWLHVLSRRSSQLGSSKAWWIRPTEIAFMACFWYIFGYRLVLCTLPTWPIRVAFVLVSHIITMPLHVQITLSHWGMSTSDLGESESFPQRQLRTTMDVDCPAWLDFIHGGLQFQAVHHLFPRLPRHNLRKAQVFVKDFCRDTEIPYSILGFVNGNKKVIGRLEEVSDQLRTLLGCQKYMAETGESALH
ncbi:fatty acid desaturase [Colletotrichum graminicola]|uniref:Delta 8-(E)-sphingolipid desaturase n=1 Tax=Colletotrichum graminicola (strain M1.001 / M2 / FGSC 10212) TaxID=645133 RepID=E3QWW2_COLGM|nr:fatty acid desaturase [Colletotrichum graminicola M1.001]EFQ35350.1 fatty acid desaturase [Colletotrichum graminicola M1.001]WDK22063.1 fatty acid desaturase [Colletotrichum graminicola]